MPDPAVNDIVVMSPIKTSPTPDVSASTGTVLGLLGAISQENGDPLSVDLSSLLREVTISLPSTHSFACWCAALNIMVKADATTDVLGSFLTVTTGDPASGQWRIRLICHASR